MLLANLVFLNAIANLAYSIGAVIILILTLRFLDYLAGFKFREWLHNASDEDKSRYFSARIIAASIIIGLIVSVPV